MALLDLFELGTVPNELYNERCIGFHLFATASRSGHPLFGTLYITSRQRLCCHLGLFAAVLQTASQQDERALESRPDFCATWSLAPDVDHTTLGGTSPTQTTITEKAVKGYWLLPLRLGYRRGCGRRIGWARIASERQYHDRSLTAHILHCSLLWSSQ